MKVKCERDGMTFETKPLFYLTAEYQMSEKRCKEEGYRHPCRYINCPICGRGYFQETNGRWMSDRPLTILEEE